MNNLYREFYNLFHGLDRAHGVWYKSGKMETLREEPTYEKFESHLDGKIGLGIIPVTDKSKSFFGVIDVDAHGEGEKIDFAELESKVDKMNLPLVLCRSKSGSAHLYVFFKEAVSTKKVRNILARWATALGYKGIEVFPKQTKLGKDQLGNWINLPYFEAKKTVRFGIKNGNKLNLEQFITEATDRQQTEAAFIEADKHLMASTELEGAPPCLIYMYLDGVPEGSRNDALFSYGVYFRKSTDNWEDSLNTLNYSPAMIKPLPKREIDVITGSVGKSNDYKYKCGSPPISNYCDKDLCRLAKYGVHALGGEYDDLIIGSITKVLSDPPRWIMELNSKPLELSTEELMSYRLLRKVVVERLSLIVAPSKEENYLLSLRPKLEEKNEIEAPDDASVGGIIQSMLIEYVSYAGQAYQKNGEAGKKEDILRGVPTVLKIGDELIIHFRGSDFIAFLKRKRAEEKKGANLWSILRTFGCGHKKIRIKDKVVQIWTYPYYEELDELPCPMDSQKEEF